jgi:hypothetical protein
MCNSRPDFQSERAEMLCYEIGGARFAIGELGMFVDIATPRDDFAGDLRRAAIDFGVEPACLSVKRGSKSEGYEGQQE